MSKNETKATAPAKDAPAAPAKDAPAAPVALVELAPVARGKAAPHIDTVKRLLTGNGGTVAQLCATLSLSDKDTRGVIDAIRAREGYDSLPRVGRLFVYKGKDGKGYVAPAKG